MILKYVGYVMITDLYISFITELVVISEFIELYTLFKPHFVYNFSIEFALKVETQ